MLSALALAALSSALVAAAPAPQYDNPTSVIWDPSSSGAATTWADSSSSAWDGSASSWYDSSASTWYYSSSTSSAWSSTPTSADSVAAPVTSTSSSAAPIETAPSGSAPVAHLVTVGGPGGQPLRFDPEFVNANIGDHVIFTFRQKNHTITQSSFAEPCKHLQAPDGSFGLDSGFVPVPEDTNVFPGWSLNVTVTTPLWFYCRQGVHCSQGMVFAVNPPASGNTFEAFKNNALAVASASATPTWTQTQAARWSGVGVVAQYSTGVTTPTALAQSTGTTSTGAAGPTSTGAAASISPELGWFSAAIIGLLTTLFAL